MRRIHGAAVALLVCLVAGCGSAGQSGETATLWVTRDRGEHVLVEADVPAGLTAIQALQCETDVETRYGGRFVHSVDGREGSLDEQRDWFYFVNGYEADRGAAEYRLRPGDVAWWDFRSWSGSIRQPIVVGAFPEPFLHGYGGKRREAVVRYDADLAAPARAIGRLIRAGSVARADVAVPRDANVFRLVRGRPRFQARLRGEGAGAPVEFVFAGDAVRLAENPRLARFRYEGLP